MTFMEQVFAVFAVLTILGASVTYWRTHRRRYEKVGSESTNPFGRLPVSYKWTLIPLIKR